MKFTRAASFLAVAALAVAVPTPNGPDGNCDVGTLNCCNSTQTAGSLSLTQLIEFIGLGLQLGQLVGNLGLSCNPITAGLGASSCNASPVCCTGNTFSGLVTLGCTAISL